MKTVRISKILGTAAILTLGLMAGASQADHPGSYTRVYAPEFNRPAMGPGFGQPMKDLSIDQRQRILMARIDQGVRRGNLTRQEAWDLTRDLQRIEWLERRFESDGWLGRHEWNELDRLLDRLSRDLRQDLRDGEWRGDHAWDDRGHAWR